MFVTQMLFINSNFASKHRQNQGEYNSTFFFASRAAVLYAHDNL